VNFFKVLFSPGLQGRFSSCEGRIKRLTEPLTLQLHTAGHIYSQRRENDTIKRDQEMMKLLKATVVKPNAIAVVQFPFRFLQNCIRNDSFFGRQDHVKQLDTLLSPELGTRKTSDKSMRSIVIHGLGGCGKSSVAKEYMYLRFDQYKVILWLYADTATKLDAQCILLARALGLDVAEGHTREAVLHWINHLCKLKHPSFLSLRSILAVRLIVL
jgi:hypothetical protein